MQGRTPKGLVHQSYIRIKTKTLKEEYIKCLPHIVIQEIEKVRTELDVTREKNVELESENNELKKQNEKTNQRIDNLEKIVMGNLSDDEKRELHNLL